MPCGVCAGTTARVFVYMCKSHAQVLVFVCVCERTRICASGHDLVAVIARLCARVRAHAQSNYKVR